MILSPAGDLECLYAAVKSGCDEVYLGFNSFNARNGAKNFSESEMEHAVKYCHLRGVSVNLTMNTLIYENDIGSALDLVDTANDFGVDALIVQDLGLAYLIKNRYPDVRLHASTQLACHNLAGVNALSGLFSRVVLSRELTLCQIENIVKNTNLEIEVFIHGALCISVSGACLMSSFIGGRSGNRGKCAQPCRLNYSFENQTDKPLLSPKDLCAADYIRRLQNIGVHSLKIEGRLKNAQYVQTVTRYYREILDNSSFPLEVAKENMEKTYSRGGFCDGFLKTADNDFDLTYPNSSQKTKISKDAPIALPDISKNTDINIAVKIYPGKNPYIKISSKDIQTEFTLDEITSSANNKPLTYEIVKNQICKTDTFPFNINSFECETKNAFMPLSKLNELRRLAFEKFADQILLNAKPDWGKKNPVLPELNTRIYDSDPKLFVQVNDLQTALFALKNDCDGIYLNIDYTNFQDDLNALSQYFNSGKEIFLALPLFLDDNELNTILAFAGKFKHIITGLLCPNIGSAYMAHKRGFLVQSDYFLYCTNSYSAMFLQDMGVSGLTRSVETNIYNKITSPVLIEGVVHGKLPLMNLRHCFKKACNKTACENCDLRFDITDRKSVVFPVLAVKTDRCTLKILNSIDLSLAKKFDKLPRLDSYRIIADNQTGLAEIIRIYKNCILGIMPNEEDIALLQKNGYTYGHWFKGAL